MVMRTAVTILFFSLLTAAEAPPQPISGFLPDSAKREHELEARFDQLLDRKNFQQWMKRLSSKPHHVGSPGSKAVAEFIAAQFKSWGYETTIETFYPLFPTPRYRT